MIDQLNVNNLSINSSNNLIILNHAPVGFKKASDAINSGHYDMVVLDEINVAVDYSLLEENKVIALLKEKPQNVTVILTGRNASPNLVKLADTVSEILAIKHHYQSGVKSCAGIEY